MGVAPPPPPQVSLSGSKWLVFIWLQAVLAFNPMILNGLPGKYLKTKDLLCGKSVESETQIYRSLRDDKQKGRDDKQKGRDDRQKGGITSRERMTVEARVALKCPTSILSEWSGQLRNYFEGSICFGMSGLWCAVGAGGLDKNFGGRRGDDQL
jgi:hypothetical protein